MATFNELIHRDSTSTVEQTETSGRSQNSRSLSHMTIILTPHLESVIIFFREDKLRYKLKGLYPQLIFDKPARRNTSQVVHGTNIRLVGTGAVLPLGAIQSSSETSIESNLFTQVLAS